MKNPAHKRTNVYAFLAIAALSAVTMLWLFWHYPVTTGIATIAVLAGLGVSARLARFVQNDSRPELPHGKQSY